MEGARVKSSLPGLAQLLARDKSEPFFFAWDPDFWRVQNAISSRIRTVDGNQKSGGNAPVEVGS